jgi:hypothetical protein
MHLKEMKQLTFVYIVPSGTTITNAGINALKKAMPTAGIMIGEDYP